jgi:hypothetical protein
MRKLLQEGELIEPTTGPVRAVPVRNLFREVWQIHHPVNATPDPMCGNGRRVL